MKQGLRIVALLFVVMLFALAWYFYRGASVPIQQPPLVSLTQENFDQLRTAFNAATGEVRIVLLLSPT